MFEPILRSGHAISLLIRLYDKQNEGRDDISNFFFPFFHLPDVAMIRDHLISLGTAFLLRQNMRSQEMECSAEKGTEWEEKIVSKRCGTRFHVSHNSYDWAIYLYPGFSESKSFRESQAQGSHILCPPTSFLETKIKEENMINDSLMSGEEEKTKKRWFIRVMSRIT